MSVKVQFGQNVLKNKNKGPAPKATPGKVNSPFNKGAAAKKNEKEVEEKKEDKKTGKAPKFIETLQDLKASVGKTAIIDCVCEGEPEPDVDWYHDGKLIKDEGRFRYLYEKDDVIGLEIRKVEAADEGEYKCVAFNKSGKVECKCNILVDDPNKSKPKEPEPAKPAVKKDPPATKISDKKSKKKNPTTDIREGITHENPEKFYTMGDEIGRGKFAVVKRCKSKKTGKEFAAKIIKYDDETLKFAIREYDIMTHAGFKHPGLVALHEAYIVRKYLILIMDLCDGKSLLDYVASKHSLTEDDVANYIRQLLEILAAVHNKNIVHLDLRPTNIRFKNKTELQILDWNSARTMANKKAGQVVDILGDTEFCAPELLNFDPVQPTSDVWTVAVNMFIMLCGTSPFYNENEDLVILNVQKLNYDSGLISHATSEAKDFIKKCFKKAPEMRMTAEKALAHKWLSNDYANARKNSKLDCSDTMKETDERLYEEEEEEYIYPSLELRTFDQEEYESPEESDEEED